MSMVNEIIHSAITLQSASIDKKYTFFKCVYNHSKYKKNNNSNTKINKEEHILLRKSQIH